ncbi:MAG: type II toxin-antitoxin system Phd/YefM family antitoxin [Armatimonadota bacterium]
MVTATIAQTREQLSDLINRVVYRDERVVITKHGKPVAAVIPIHSLQALDRLTSLLNEEKAQKAFASLEGETGISLERLKQELGISL